MKVRPKGISLIEISVSIALLATVGVFMTRIFTQGHRYSRKFKMHTTACFLAQEKLEQLSTDSDATLFTNPDSHDEARAQVDATFPDFFRTVDITCPYAGFSNLAQMTVTVDWQAELAQQSVVLQSLIADF